MNSQTVLVLLQLIPTVLTSLMSSKRQQIVLILLIALAHPIVSFRHCLFTGGRFKTSSLTERESSEDNEKTPLAQFMDAFADSLLGSTHSFQKITLTEPVDDGFAPKWTAIDGRLLKEKNKLQLSYSKGKTVLGSSNHDIDEGISFIQQCLQVRS